MTGAGGESGDMAAAEDAAGRAKAERSERLDRARQAAFLAALRETSDVRASARLIGVTASTLYRARARKPGFAEAWARTVAEGREALATELLARARGISPPEGAGPDLKLGLDLLKHMDGGARARPAAEEMPAPVSLVQVHAVLVRRLAALARRLEREEQG